MKPYRLSALSTAAVVAITTPAFSATDETPAAAPADELRVAAGTILTADGAAAEGGTVTTFALVNIPRGERLIPIDTTPITEGGRFDVAVEEQELRDYASKATGNTNLHLYIESGDEAMHYAAVARAEEPSGRSRTGEFAPTEINPELGRLRLRMGVGDGASLDPGRA